MIKSLLRIIALIKKEFVAMWMDKGTRKILILPIIIQSFIFGYGASFNPEIIPFAFYDEAKSAKTTELFNDINSTLFKLTDFCYNPYCLKNSVSDGNALIGIYVKSDFAKDPKIFVIADARNTTSANIAIGYLTSIVAAFNHKHYNSEQININTRLRFNENNISRFSIMTGMILALSFIQVMLLSSFSVSREREDGTFDMLLMTPANPAEILIGKAVPPTLVAIMQGLMLFIICRFYFEIPFAGSLLNVIFILSLFSISIVSFGLAISALAKSPQQSLVFVFTLILPSIILSGMLTPISAMPAWFQSITKLNPLYYGMTALQRVYLEGQNFYEIAPLLIPLILVGLALMPLTMYLFRHKID